MTTATIERLDERFGIAGALRFAERKGHAVARVETRIRAEIALHGAHLLSWQPAGGGHDLVCAAASGRIEKADPRRRADLLAVVRTAATDATKPQHGLVRTEMWDVE